MRWVSFIYFYLLFSFGLSVVTLSLFLWQFQYSIYSFLRPLFLQSLSGSFCFICSCSSTLSHGTYLNSYLQQVAKYPLSFIFTKLLYFFLFFFISVSYCHLRIFFSSSSFFLFLLHTYFLFLIYTSVFIIEVRIFTVESTISRWKVRLKIYVVESFVIALTRVCH